MKKYDIGITIGPIFDTVRDASTPAALWFASSLFSDITRRICQEVLKLKNYENITIFSPYYSEEIRTDDGVGKFHDRIIFSLESRSEAGNEKEVLRSELQQLVDKVKGETCDVFVQRILNDSMREFLFQYLQISFVILEREAAEKQNCILTLSPYLDALELMKTFPADQMQNPIRRTFAGEKNNKNVYIKESPLFARIQKADNQFRKANGAIRSIEEIAAGAEAVNGKTSKYYAVIHADGDGMGKFLEGIGDEEISCFSKACLSYAEEAAKRIIAFGGMMIYAGGDDLLFLAPVADDTNKTVFEVCDEIRELFQQKLLEQESLKNRKNLPTISFGIAIRYVKFPLYEALDASRALLYQAKSLGGEKNRMAIDVQKHSGQSFGLAVSNLHCQKMLEIVKSEKNTEQMDGAEVQSLLYTLGNMKVLLGVLSQDAKRGAMDCDGFVERWMNLFDNADQKGSKSYLEMSGRYYYQYFLAPMSEEKIDAVILNPDGDVPESQQELSVFTTVLRMRKFLAEKEEEA